MDLDEQALVEACAEIGGNQVSYLVADVTSAQDNTRMVETATERYGGVDIFLANAGIEGDVASILDYDEARFDQVMSVNVKGPFLALRAAVPAMRLRNGGSIIIVMSITGVRGGPAFGTLCNQQTCGHRVNEVGCAGVCR